MVQAGRIASTMLCVARQDCKAKAHLNRVEVRDAGTDPIERSVYALSQQHYDAEQHCHFVRRIAFSLNTMLEHM